MTRRVARGLWLAIGAMLIILPALPLQYWTGAPDAGPAWQPNLVAWGLGLLVILVVALAAGRLAAGLRLRKVRLPSLPPRRWAMALAVLLAGLAATAMLDAFARNPHLIDEVAQLFQSRIFAAGRIAAPVPEPPEFFLVAQTLISDAGWVSQYPPGQSLLLAVGMLLGLEWLVNPILGGISVLLVFYLARGMFGIKVGVAACLLWAASSWVLFMSATYMNHVGATTLALGAWTALWAPRRCNRWHVLVAGFLLGATAATRPLDGVACALPMLVWMVARRRVTSAAWLALGMLPVAIMWGYLNWQLFGSPITLGYSAHYGSDVGLGFHMDPWGHPYTPLIAVSNVATAVRRLHIYFYEWPIPALLPLALWGVLGRQWSWKDLVMGAGVVAGPLLYFFYWHSGFYPGPRMYYIAAPFLVLALARGWHGAWRWSRRRSWRHFRADVALASAASVVLVWGSVGLLPRRWDAYRTQLPSMKLHPEREMARAGVHRALVIVPESWGSRIIANLWGLGAPPGLVERAYRRGDACDLHHLAIRARAGRLSETALVAALERMMDATGPQPQSRPDWPDPSLRLRRGAVPADCAAEMQRDLDGFTLYGSLAWRNAVGLKDGIVFARDMHERNGALLAHYEGWPVWRYAPPPGQPQSEPVLRRVDHPLAADLGMKVSR
ncbi:MAG: hypothetical protein JSW71_23385 [Gemmatimonadota bacterium]|nr:MAG: hypothetical protein JSW71_23385 [Gemmatimonadota bacterium]